MWSPAHLNNRDDLTLTKLIDDWIANELERDTLSAQGLLPLGILLFGRSHNSAVERPFGFPCASEAIVT